MRVIFMTESEKYLGIKEVEYNDGTPKEEKLNVGLKEKPNAEKKEGKNKEKPKKKPLAEK